MADKQSDLIMMFIDQTGKKIPGQGRTELKSSETGGNSLMKGFEKGYIFEVESFSFGARADGRKDDPVQGGLLKVINQLGGNNPNAVHLINQLGRHVDSQSQANAAANAQAKDEAPPIEEVRFTRAIDAASPAMMQNLIDSIGYKSASIIKRKAAGGVAAGEVYLRMDFNDVLITNMEWSDDDQVKESFTCICRSVKLQYRPQLPDGTLGATIPGEWPSARK